MGLREQGLDKLVHVVLWLLKRVRLIDPVKDDVAGALVTQLKWHLRLTRCLVIFGGRSSQEKKRLVTLTNESIISAGNCRSGICSAVLLNLFLHRGIKHDIDHVLDVVKSLRLKVIQDLSDELFFSPYEQHALLHHIRRNDEFFELFNSQA